MLKKLYCAIASVIAIALFSQAAFAASESWGIYFPKDGSKPEANAGAEHLLQFDAYFMGDENDKVVYLTFDAGYENDFTAGMLDVLQKHNAPAAFFVVGTYIRDYPQLVQRMLTDGHIVANHTMTHPDMSKIEDKAAFEKELTRVEELFRELTGTEIPRFYRPPRGIYSETNLRHAKELGYKTIFWSTAYKDWEVNNQPSHEEAYAKLMPRTHPGAIILLHNVSKTNAEILDGLLTKYTELGYRFESLYHLTGITPAGKEAN